MQRQQVYSYSIRKRKSARKTRHFNDQLKHTECGRMASKKIMVAVGSSFLRGVLTIATSVQDNR